MKIEIIWLEIDLTGEGRQHTLIEMLKSRRYSSDLNGENIVL